MERWRYEFSLSGFGKIEIAPVNAAKTKLKKRPKRRRLVSRVWLCVSRFHGSRWICKRPMQIARNPARSKMLYWI